ncbi:CAP domain-containing protein [Streptomyces corynorhini]|uniref:CAP domain-containing protein n=1 Tax=Streptomyces corynorhini TaxID=2282652 RepID=A0A370BKL6_9ACTN|nr:CAP domain-containing protein [Streptomyces corynorhini]RDG39875.1 CAP domain-containing protein [Streptomyces corynorhini]
MGRHRRNDATGAPVVSPDAHASDSYGDGAAAAGHTSRGATRRKGRVARPVKTGLLGASAAMAVGAVAVASGLLPGGGQFTVNGGGATGEQIRSDIAPELEQQGGASEEPTRDASASPSRGAERTKAPTKSASPSATKPSVTPSKESKAAAAPPKQKATESPSGSGSGSGSGAATGPASGTAPSTENATEDRGASAPDASAAAAVLSLVNQERAKVGCAAVRADGSLDALAQAFSDDMAARGFFDHTDPDGRTPWDRADKAGVKNLGGENIARGQATAQAVMESWMNSDGHRANILNCDYTRLGVGVHTGAGGPWWTQDFGF